MLEMAPGPAEIPEIVRKSLASESPYFGSVKFSTLFKKVQVQLREVFDTKNFILVGNGSGSLGLEVSVLSFFNIGDRIAIITSGKYGDNWNDMCLAHGLDVVRLNASYSPTCYPIEKFEKFCEENAKRLKGLFVTHFETTSGVLNPISEYLRIYRKHGGTGLFIVDAVSSLLTEPLKSDDYDVVIGASQKALSLPPGLFFMSVSDDALEAAKKKVNGHSLYYFDLLKEYKYQKVGTSVFTTSSHLIQALHVSLTVILSRGVQFVISKCRDSSDFVRIELSGYFSRFPKDEGNAVSVFKCDYSEELVRVCGEMGLVLGYGVRKLHESTFRLRTFGWDLNTSDLIQACNVIKRADKLIKGGNRGK